MGDCIQNSGFYDNFAWSIYVIEMALWTHGIILIVWMTCLWIWCVVIWLMVFLMLTIALVALACGFLASGNNGGSGGHCECPRCECNDNCCICDDQCCIVFNSSGYDLQIFDAYPSGNGGSLCNNRSTSQSCDCCCVSTLCKTTMWMISLCPSMPQNMHGGFLGYVVFGTHIRTDPRHTYAGGNCLIDSMEFRNWNVEHNAYSSNDWRERVRRHLGIASHSQPWASRSKLWMGGSRRRTIQQPSILVCSHLLTVYLFSTKLHSTKTN